MIPLRLHCYWWFSRPNIHNETTRDAHSIVLDRYWWHTLNNVTIYTTGAAGQAELAELRASYQLVDNFSQ